MDYTDLERIKDVYRNADVIDSGSYFTTVNELTDQLPALRPATLNAAVNLIVSSGAFDVDKIVVEEDKGVVIGAPVALQLGLPLAIARWYTYQLDDCNRLQTKVDIKSEYFSGQLYLNGVEKGDRVALVDDTISTGGTLVALIEAVRKAGGEVREAYCVVEKVKNRGVRTVFDRTGVNVCTALKIEIKDGTVCVLE